MNRLKVSEILKVFDEFAPFSLQASYDNSGLLVGNKNDEITKILFTIDVTEAVIDEAIQVKADCIIAHHPLIFNGLRRLNSSNDVERSVEKAIKHSIAIICVHTNIDFVAQGVNKKIADKIGLHNQKILSPIPHTLLKIVSFVPTSHYQSVFEAMALAGAGHIGNYDMCGFSTSGYGTFRALDDAQPFVGKPHTLHTEQEQRVEMILPRYKKDAVIAALLATHPYQEVAYDIYSLENYHTQIGSGIIGDLHEKELVPDFLQRIKSIFETPCIRVTDASISKIVRVAVCGGSGSSLISHAISQQADIFITADVKYHDFFLSENKMIIADIGHYESEQYTKEIFYEIVTKKFPKFATHFSTVNTNPIKYL